MSGVMPVSKMPAPSGVSHSMTPSRMAEPSDSGKTLSTVPVPKVRWPMTRARSLSWSAAATISAELALP